MAHFVPFSQGPMVQPRGLAGKRANWYKLGSSCGESEIRKCLGNAPGEFRIQSHTSNLLNLVWFSDLKFLNVNATKILGTSNPPH
jgi:hypothetical protein